MVVLVALVRSFLTASAFGVKHSVSRTNVIDFINKGSIPCYAVKKSSTPFYIDDDYCIYMKSIYDSYRSELQLNYEFLSAHMTTASIVRLCILGGANVIANYGRTFFKKSLYTYRKTSVLVHHQDFTLLEFHRTSSFLSRVVKFLGTFDEEEIALHICEVLGVEYNPSHIKKKAVYTVVCTRCCMPRTLKHKPRVYPKLCVPCNLKDRADHLHKCNIKSDSEKIRYWYFCPSCPSIRESIDKRKTPFCSKCVHKGRQVKYASICPDCPPEDNFKWVTQKKKCGILQCLSCSNKSSVPEVFVKPIKKKRKKTYSRVGVDGAKRNKVTVQFQIVDEHTMEVPKKEVVIPATPRELELKMQEDWLKNNSVESA